MPVPASMACSTASGFDSESEPASRQAFLVSAYPNGKFTITRRLLDMLTPQGVAIWYMDDGSARVNVNKEGFVSSCATDIALCKSEDEALIVCGYFADEYGIKFRPFRVNTRKPETSWCISTNTAGSHEFSGLIFPHVIPSMMYKLKHVADLKTHECRALVGSCKICGDVLYSMRRRGMCVKCYTRDRVAALRVMI